VVSGKRTEAVKLLGDLKKRSNPGYSNASEIAVIYASLGDTDQAMNWLEKGYEERFNPGVLLRPGFDPLRSDPRFQNLVRPLAYPDEICVICAVTETCCLRAFLFSQLGKRASHSAFSLRSSRPESPLAMLQRFCAYGKMIHGAVRFCARGANLANCRRAMSIR